MFSNGKRLFTWLSAAGAIFYIISMVGSWYAGWSQKVEASMTERKMVADHDQMLRELAPKIESIRDSDEHQQWDIDQTKNNQAEIQKQVLLLTDQVGRTNDLLREWLKAKMRESR